MGDPSAVRDHRTQARWFLRLSKLFFALAVFFLLAGLAAAINGLNWPAIKQQAETALLMLMAGRWYRLEALESADTALALDSGWEKPDVTTRIRALLRETETTKESRS